MSQRDYYQVLGVTQDASHSDIRAAFVRLSKQHHPDSAGRDGALPWRLQDVQQAYHCLSDATKRAVHDRALAEDQRQHFARQRRIQQRLYQYDQRHPARPPRAHRRTRWAAILVVAIVAAIGLQVWHLLD